MTAIANLAHNMSSIA